MYFSDQTLSIQCTRPSLDCREEGLATQDLLQNMQIISESFNDLIVVVSYISYISYIGYKGCIVILRSKMKQCQVLNTLPMSS